MSSHRLCLHVRYLPQPAFPRWTERPQQQYWALCQTWLREVDGQCLTLDIARANLMCELSVLESESLRKTRMELDPAQQRYRLLEDQLRRYRTQADPLCRWLGTWRPSALPMHCSSCPTGAEPPCTTSPKMIWCTWTSQPVIRLSLVNNYSGLKISVGFMDLWQNWWY